MFFKISFFLTLSCIFNFGLAWVARNDLESRSSGKSFRDFTYDIEKSFKELTQNSQWIYNLVSIVRSGMEEGFETITSYPVDLILRTELFVMADGSHFVFPISENDEMEEHHRAIAITVSNLMMNLKTMERADKVMKNATRYFVSKDFGHLRIKDQQKSLEKKFANLLHEYFKIVEHKMKGDEELRDEFEKRVKEAQETVHGDSEMRGPLDEIWGNYLETKYAKVEEVKSFFQDKKTFHRAIANKLFMKQSVKHFSMIFRPSQHQRYLLARAMIQKAVGSYSTESKINDVYQQALAKVGELEINDFNVVRDTFFGFLEKALGSDPTLYDEIKILMKQIEKTTSIYYESDMVYIDFSIL